MQKFKSNISIRILLLPFAWMYGFGIFLRNKAFDLNILKSKSFQAPIISVGNLTVGGTGKTPHVEFLIELLMDSFHVGVLSRGYKRKTKGYVYANKKASPSTIGDEPFQIYCKYKGIELAVCEKRVFGVAKLLERKKKPAVILLDDAFQHRYLKPGLSVLLVDYNRPVFMDFLLPAGDLREGFSGRKRADIVIVTKCPGNLELDTIALWREKLKLSKNQSLFFTKVEYGKSKTVFGDSDKELSLKVLKKEKVKVLLVTGIANPLPIKQYLKEYGLNVKLCTFPDHHNFSKEDIKKIKKDFKAISGQKKVLFTTEKDAVRLKQLKKFPRNMKYKLYALPISIKVLHGKQKEFEQLVLNYVRSH